ncbi:MAG: NAD-dependent protein deacylase [Candidatus Lokiarchaeota archaeon]|nr:NAD-dependent protein deacylase [Candidatus Lokiarchaeota archaeon]
MSEDQIDKLADMIIESNYTIVLTGAGISTESGIPDFRSPGTGLWDMVDPVEFGSIESFQDNQNNFYELARKLAPKIFSARPNKGHKALAKLEKMKQIKVIITQNIDNLHQRAHSKNVIEVHGNLQECYCMKCKREYDIWVLAEKVFEKGEAVPTCDYCGGVIRPNVVMFGEKLPQRAISEALYHSERCDLLIVVGSSLVVSPINFMPSRALSNDAKLVIINWGKAADTHFDSRANIVIREKSGVVLPKVLKKVKEKLNGDKK